MARIRSIKPEFWVSEQVVECSPMARLLFVGMWSFCDDSGIHPASCKTLKMEVFPGDDITVGQIEGYVSELIGAGLLKGYAVDGKGYWRVTGWHHQKIEKPTFKYPDESGSVPSRLAVDDKSANGSRKVDDSSPPERSGEESSRVEELSSSEDPSSADADDLTPCPHGEIIDLYNSTLAAQGWTAVNPKFWKGSRADSLRARWREDERRQDVSWWQGFFSHVAKSDWLMGKVAGRDGRTFRGDLEWLVTFRNFAKVCEGKYHG